VTRLKEVPVVNSLLVAVAWALPVVLVPIGFADATVTPAAGFLVLYFTFATFVSTEVSNVRDIESDRAAGVSTLPTALGLSRTRVALYGLSACTLAILAVGVGWGALGVFQAGVLSLGVASLVMVVSLFGRISNERLLALGAECTPVPVLGVLAVVPVV
jgi:4-hydroxybenzoate polyprenyltransferase